MKKFLKLSAMFIVTVLAVFAVAACGGEEAAASYTVKKITYTPNNQFNEAWMYLGSHQQYSTNKSANVRLLFEVDLTDEAGNAVKGEIDLFASGSETTATAVSFDGSDSNTRLSVSVPEIPNTELKRKMPVNIVFSSMEGSSVKLDAPITVTVNVDIVKAIKEYSLNLTELKSEYVKGDYVDLSGGKIDLVYRDETSESISLEDAMEMPQFKGTEVWNFDSGVPGFEKSMRIEVKIQDNGSKTNTAKYNVLPGPEWEEKTEANLKYYLHKSMTASTEKINGLDFVVVTLDGSDTKLKMVCDTNYDYAAINPGADGYQTEINAEITAQNPASAFNALRPADETATVNSVNSTRGADAIEYTLSGGEKFTMYAKISSFSGTLYKQRAMTITVENESALTEAQKALVLDFVSVASSDLK